MSRELERALLQWVNTFQLSKEVSAWTDFEDGQIFWQILLQLDSDYFHGELPESSEACRDNWIPRWKNVKHVHHMVLSYMNMSNMLPHYTQHLMPDLKAVASEGAPEHTIQTVDFGDMKMLKAIVYVALFSEKSNPHQVHLFQTTGLTTFSAPIKKMIDDMRETEDQLATSHAPGSEFENSYADTPARSASHDRSADASRDKEEELLDMEAKWYETVSANNDLRSQVATLREELEKSHRQTRNLEEQLTESEQSFKRKFEEYRERERQQHLAEGGMSDKDFIAQLESELAEAKAQLENQGRQLHKFHADSVSKQELRDQIQLLTFERDELQQKAKANENLKKKIQTLQEFERKYQGIADTLEDSKSKLEQYEDLKQKYEDLRRANQESLRTIQSCEQQIMVEAERNKILQHEKKHKEQELEQTKEFVQHYIDLKEELESRIRELENNGPATSRLDDELAMEDSELVETPRATVPEGAGSGADVLILQQKLELAESRAKRIEEQYLNVYEENLGLQTALTDGSLGNGAITSHPSVRLQDRLHAAEEELKNSKEQRFAATAENASLRDQLAKASIDLTGERLDSATAGELDALRINHSKLLQDLADLQQYSKTVVEQLADQRSLLRRAMLKRLNGDEPVVDEDTLQRIKEQVAIPAHAPAAEKDDLILEVSMSLAAELVKLNDSATKAADYEALKQELEQVRKEAGEKATEAVVQELENQRRENDLIVSAWYSISSRLQSNVVALARKAEAPKSWMRRQQFNIGGGVTMTRR